MSVTFHQSGSLGSRDDGEPFLLVADNILESIFQVNATSGSRIQLPLGDPRFPISVDYDPATDFVYWSDRLDGDIKRAHRDGSGRETIVTDDVYAAYGLALDHAGGNVYWTDSIASTVSVARMDGSFARSLLTSPAVGIPADWGIDARIDRAAMDGSNQTTIISDLTDPNMITIDYKENRLYYSDGYAYSLYSSDLLGNDIRRLFYEDGNYLFGIGIDDDNIYWTSWTNDQILMLPRWNLEQNETVLVDGLGTPNDIYVSGESLVDVTNGCSQSNGGCQDLCLARPGGRTCACRALWELHQDGMNCLPPDLVSPSYLWLDHSYRTGVTSVKMTPGNGSVIRELDDQGRNVPVTVLFSSAAPSRIEAIDYDFQRNLVFWVDTGLREIHTVDIHDSKIQSFTTLFEGISSGVEGLAVDWLNQNLYYTDAYFNWIGVISYKYTPSRHHVIVHEGLSRPSGIAVHPQRGYLFWSERSSSTIERSALSGQQRTKIVIVDIQFPSGLVINGDRLFWADTFRDRIESCDLNGDNREVFFTYFGTHFYDITTDGVSIAATDWADDSINFLYGGETSGSFLHYGDGTVYGVEYFDQSRQPPGQTECQVDNGGCNHTCVGDPEGHRCLCLLNFHLAEDNHTCIANEHQFSKAVFVGSDSGILQLPHNFLDLPEAGDWTDSYIVRGTKTFAMDFDYIGKMLFYTQQQNDGTQTIERFLFIGEGSSMTVFQNGQGIEGIAVDWVASNLYWTERQLGRIHVSKLDGSLRKVLMSGLGQPSSIAVHPEQSYVFWTEVGANPKISRASPDGSNKMVLVSSQTNDLTGSPTALAIDYNEERLYWVTTNPGSVESCNFDGWYVRTLRSADNADLFGVAFYKDYALWTDNSNQTLTYGRAYSGETHHDSRTVALSTAAYNIKVYDDTEQMLHTSACDQRNGGCMELCLPLENSRVCACGEGRYLQADGVSCSQVRPTNIPTTPPPTVRSSGEDFLLVADYDTGYITEVNATSGSNVTLPLHSTSPLVLDYDSRTGYVYWSDYYDEIIYRAKRDGSGFETLVDNTQVSVSAINGLALDYAGQNIYWTDYWTEIIGVARMDGRHAQAIVSENLNWPGDIVLDPTEGYMYWTDESFWTPRIERAAMDGSDRTVIVDTDLDSPVGITIDLIERRLYWCDSWLYNIQSSDLDGNNRQTLLSRSYGRFYGLSLNAHELFWTSSSDSYIGANSKSESDQTTSRVVADGFSSLRGIAMYSPDTATDVSNACSVSNGGCQDICLARPGGRTCVCRAYFHLQSDNATCAPPEIKSPSFLWINEVDGKTLLTALEANSSIIRSPDFQSLPLTTVMAARPPSIIVSLDYDIRQGLIFWIDIGMKEIQQVDVRTGMVTTLLNAISAGAEALATDWINQNLYYTDFNYNRITMVSYGLGSSTGNIHIIAETGLDKPRGIAVDPSTGYVFWSDWGQSPKIERSTLSGEDRTAIVESDLGRPSGLVIDYATSKLYFADTERDTIDSCDFDGGNRRQFYSLPGTHFYDITFDGEEILASDWSDTTINFIHDSRPLTFVRPRGQNIMAVEFFHESRQPQSQSDCQVNNGGCQHTCVGDQSGHKCLCLADYNLAQDQQTCVKNDHMFTKALLVSTDDGILQFPHNLADLPGTADSKPTVLVRGGKTVAMDFNYNANLPADSEPANLPADFEPANLPADCEPANLHADFEPANLPVNSEILHLPADSEPANRPADSEPANLPADSEPANRPADSEPAKLIADSEPANLPAGSEPANVPADSEPANLSADFEPANVPADSEPANLPADSEPANLPADSEPANLHADSEPANLPAYSEPVYRSADSEPANRPADSKTANLPAVSEPANMPANSESANQKAIYYTKEMDDGTHSIQKYDLTTNSSLTIYTGGQGIEGLAVDWVAANIYWTEKNSGTISVARLDGSFRKVLLSGLVQPRGVAVHPEQRLLYWTETGSIVRSTLAGTDKGVIVSSQSDESVQNPAGISFDLLNSWVYWADSDAGTVMASDLRGEDPELRWTSNGGELFGIAVYKDFNFWTDRTNKTVSIGLRSSLEKVVQLQTTPHSVRVFDGSEQPLSRGPCDLRNGDCNELCLPTTADDKVCACTEGHLMQADNLTCYNPAATVAVTTPAVQTTPVTPSKPVTTPVVQTTPPIPPVITTAVQTTTTRTTFKPAIACTPETLPSVTDGDFGQCVVTANVKTCNVVCKPSYGPSVSSIKCLPSGNWDTGKDYTCTRLATPEAVSVNVSFSFSTVPCTTSTMNSLRASLIDNFQSNGICQTALQNNIRLCEDPNQMTVSCSFSSGRKRRASDTEGKTDVQQYVSEENRLLKKREIMSHEKTLKKQAKEKMAMLEDANREKRNTEVLHVKKRGNNDEDALLQLVKKAGGRIMVNRVKRQTTYGVDVDIAVKAIPDTSDGSLEDSISKTQQNLQNVVDDIETEVAAGNVAVEVDGQTYRADPDSFTAKAVKYECPSGAVEIDGGCGQAPSTGGSNGAAVAVGVVVTLLLLGAMSLGGYMYCRQQRRKFGPGRDVRLSDLTARDNPVYDASDIPPAYTAYMGEGLNATGGVPTKDVPGGAMEAGALPDKAPPAQWVTFDDAGNAFQPAAEANVYQNMPPSAPQNTFQPTAAAEEQHVYEHIPPSAPPVEYNMFVNNPSKGLGGVTQQSHSGLRLVKRRCKGGYASSSDGPFLLVADNYLDSILQINVTSGSNVTLPLGDPRWPLSLDYDPNTDYVYWSDRLDRHIKRARRDGSGMETIVTTGLIIGTYGLALDHAAGNLYWTDSRAKTVSVARMDGSFARPLLTSPAVGSPGGLVLDPRNGYGYMYWTDWGSSDPRIDRAAMDGSNQTTILSDLTDPNMITIDYTENRLYYCDGGAHSIFSADLLGNDVRRHLYLPSDYLFGIAIDDDNIYWTSWTTSHIGMLSRSNNRQSVLVDSLANPNDIYVSMATPTDVTNACSTSNGGCQDLCLAKPEGRTCACRFPWELQEDGTSCLPKKLVSPSYLWLDHKSAEGVTSVKMTAGDSRVIRQLHNQSRPLPVETLFTSQSPSRIEAIDYDFQRNLIFWVDTGLREIHTVELQDGGIQSFSTLFEGISSGVEGLAVDWLNQNLYYTDAYFNWIGVVSYKNTPSRHHVIVHKGLDWPRGIAVHPIAGYVFWSDRGSQNPMIERAVLSGEQRTSVVKEDIVNPSGLVIDGNRLYWADSYRDTIESCDLNGNNRTLFYSLPRTHFYDITFDGEEIMASDWSDDSINFISGHLRGELLLYYRGEGYVYGVEFYDQSRQQSGQTDCQVNNGGCTHTCVGDPDGHRCLCLENFHLAEDNHNCIENEHPFSKALFVGSDSGILQLPHNFRKLPESGDWTDSYIVQGTKAFAMDFDYAGKMIFYTQQQADGTQNIERLSLIGEGSTTTIFENGQGIE
ncbi:hypothetical protein Bbelb_179960, partial [Branchiostoma belcheri]